MQLTEKQLQQQCENILRIVNKKKPIFWYHPHEQHYLPNEKKYGAGKKGIPDLIVCFEGKFYAFELKVGHNKLTKEQLRIMDEIAKAGGAYEVIRNIERFIAVVGQYFGVKIE